MALDGDGRCPVCRAALWAAEAGPVGQQACPRCGAELWALVGSGRPLFFPRRPGETDRAFLARLAAPLYGGSAEEIEATLRGADRLDLVEFVMELEQSLRSDAEGEAAEDAHFPGLAF